MSGSLEGKIGNYEGFDGRQLSHAAKVQILNANVEPPLPAPDLQSKIPTEQVPEADSSQPRSPHHDATTD